MQSKNDKLKVQIKEVIALKIDDIPERFRKLGLDDRGLYDSRGQERKRLRDRMGKAKKRCWLDCTGLCGERLIWFE